ncbi:protein tramtrack, beta isoform-like [Teleopsis dalmanni]|uniref:protein tramtrack, beta isoform-like n=1 Tax=Teleopsis dalmanni TaxID=139649 RepID=UPI0018CFA013|nr:protein tramtrack, beta isoform-like [Teleopsis dalmanni]
MKMASQRFCLRWNNHQSNLLSVFDQLLHAETFTDVTLAVDGQYLKAHKMVLSACSPYFNNLFVNHPEKHPIVILKDVPYSDMKSLLDFMYRGEVSVDQERLTAFLRVAESLRIKGLTEVNDDKPSAPEPTPPPQLQRIQPYLVQQQQQQRNKSQSNFVNNNNNNNNAPQMQTQQSLLSSALASMPKRKRGRPRKLSGSSNGTGNDYDEFEREGMLNDSDMGERKLNESFSGNDDGSDDNQRDSFDNDNDMDDNRDSSTQVKKQKISKEMMKAQQNDDNSTSDGHDSDCDEQMDSSYMEPQLMLDEYDEPVEFKFDPNANSTQDNAMMQANLTEQQQQQVRQQAILLATHQKQRQHLAEAAAAAAGGMKMSAVIGSGSIPGTVTLINQMVSIPKLTPIGKVSKPKVNKRAKIKQNGVSGNGQGIDTKPNNDHTIKKK